MKLFTKLVVLTLICLFASTAFAASPKHYLVTPFDVNGPSGYNYLKQAIHPLFATRLRWPDNYELLADKTVKNTPKTAAEAKNILHGSKADYLVWGNVTIVGEDCSLDVNVTSKDGKTWTKSRETRVAQLIPVLTGLCDTISAEVFKRPGTGAVVAKTDAPTGPKGPAYVGGAAPANADSRYGREDPNAVLRTQQLDFQAMGMEICDADGDGQNEVFMIDNYYIYAYKFTGGRLVHLAKEKVALNSKNLAIRSFDFDRSGKPRLIVNSVNLNEEPVTRIYSYSGNKFTKEMETRYYLNVIKDLESRRDILIGQQGDNRTMFKTSGIFEMGRNGNKIVELNKLHIKTKDFNVFNFAYLPAGKNFSEGGKIVSITKSETIRVSTVGGARLSESSDMYSGTPAGLEENPTLSGMGEDKETIRSIYYIPMRFIVEDLSGNEDYDIVMNHPVTTAGSVFKRYRSFQQSELHFLYWDGIGLSQSAAPRRYQGAVVDIALADMDNDGKLDLIACVNTSAGIGETKTVIHGTKLELPAKKQR